MFWVLLLSSDTIFHIWPSLRSLALDVSSRHAYAGNLPRKYGSNLKNHLISIIPGDIADDSWFADPGEVTF